MMDYELKTYYLDKPLVIGRVFDVFIPSEIKKDIAIFIVHGGGWRAGSRQCFHSIMEEFCNRGYMVATTDYRLYAKDAFEQVADIRETYDAFVSLLKEKNLPLKIAVYGESAGAHLVSLLSCANPGEIGEKCNLKNEWVKPYCVMLQSTPVDFLPFESMMPSMRRSMQSIAGAPYEQEPERYQRLSLINYIREDNPQIFFMEAQYENLFYSHHTKAVCDKHNTMGIESKWKVYEGAEHGFFFELERKVQKEAFEDICAYLEGNLVL